MKMLLLYHVSTHRHL